MLITKLYRSVYIRAVGFLAIVLSVLIIIFLLNVSKPGQYPTGCFEDCALQDAHKDGVFKVISLNMLHSYPDFEDLPIRLDIFTHEIQELDPDIICLQEVPWTKQTGNVAEQLANRTGLNYIYLRGNGNRSTIFFEEGLAILSKYPLSNLAP